MKILPNYVAHLGRDVLFFLYPWFSGSVTHLHRILEILKYIIIY